MRCSAANKQLQLYIDKQLTLQQMCQLEAHLTTCCACQKDLLLLEEVASSLRELPPVAEPANLTAQIMQRVAITPQKPRERYSLLRPSLLEVLAVVLLATITTLGIIWQQPTLRAVLPFANGHDLISQSFSNTLNLLVNGNTAPLMLALWVVGTVLGVSITLALAGNEMRTEWFKAMMDRLPVR
jgi:predicted anti-sigma-YlaC factor YlaD